MNILVRFFMKNCLIFLIIISDSYSTKKNYNLDQRLFQTPFQIDKIDYDWLKRKNINRIKKYSRPNKLATHSLCSVFHDCCYSRNMKNEIMSILSGQEELSIHNTLYYIIHSLFLLLCVRRYFG
jgi:hypothetical protein